MPKPVTLTDALDTVGDLRERLAALHGIEIPPEKGRARERRLGEAGREMLYLAHLCRVAEVEILNEYHQSRGYSRDL